jgi:hypothetical protein
MNEISVPRAQNRSYPSRSGEVPIATHPHGSDGDACAAQPTNERRIRRRDHQWFVTVLTLPACEQVDLALAATPFSAGVQVEDAKRL